MALLLPNSMFIQVPKTGTGWVQRALTDAGVKWEHTPGQDTWHAGFDQVKQHLGERTHVFGFVRRPEVWLGSVWSYWMQDHESGRDHAQRHKDAGWSVEAEMMDLIPCSFQAFVVWSEERSPGWVTRAMLGRLDGADWIGRQEDLCEDLIKALRYCGETFDEEAIRRRPPHNVNGQLAMWRERQGWTPTMRAIVDEAEAEMLRRFYRRMPA